MAIALDRTGRGDTSSPYGLPAGDQNPGFGSEIRTYRVQYGADPVQEWEAGRHERAARQKSLEEVVEKVKHAEKK